MGLTSDLATQAEPFQPSALPPAEPAPPPPATAPPQPPTLVIRAEGAPRRERQPKPPVPPTAQAPKTLKRLFPAGQEQLHVYRRSSPDAPASETDYVHTYNSTDLQGWTNLAAFLKKYIAPTYGPGRYECVLVSTDGAEIQREVFGIAAPAGLGSPDPLALGANRDPIMAAAAEAIRSMMDRQPMAQQPFVPRPGTDPAVAELARQIHEMRMAQQQPQQQPFAEPMQRLLMAAVDKMNSPAGPSLPGMAPAPPPDSALVAREAAREMAREMLQLQPKQPDPLDQITKMTELIKVLKGPEAPAQPPDAGTASLERMIKIFQEMGLVKKDDPTLEMREQIKKLVEQLSEQPSLAEQMEEMTGMMDTLERLGARRAGAGATGPGGMMAETLHGLTSLAKGVREIVETKADADREAREAQPQPRVVVQQVPVAVPAAPQPRSAAPIAPAPSAPSAAPRFPLGFEPYLLAMQSAQTHASRARSTLQALQELGKQPGWAAPVSTARAAMLGPNSRAAQPYIRSVVLAVQQQGGLPQEQAQAILATFEEHWDTIMARVRAPSATAQA